MSAEGGRPCPTMGRFLDRPFLTSHSTTRLNSQIGTSSILMSISRLKIPFPTLKLGEMRRCTVDKLVVWVCQWKVWPSVAIHAAHSTKCHIDSTRMTIMYMPLYTIATLHLLVSSMFNLLSQLDTHRLIIPCLFISFYKNRLSCT